MNNAEQNLSIVKEDYYPFGMGMPGRSWTSGSDNGYRFGFQGQEQDDELWGGALSFKYRVEDSRLGRFFSVDPLAAEYAYNSPYAFSENRVIDAIELEGLESVLLNDGNSIETGPIEPQAQIERFENSWFNNGQNFITSYGGGKVLEPAIVTPSGNGGSLTSFKTFRSNEWENVPNREPYDGFWGVLDYVWNGGQEGNVRYNMKGKPIGSGVTGGAGSLDIIGGPKNPTQIVNAAKTGANLAKTPVGRSGNILNVVAKNSPTTINGTKFTGHALDQMQARGILSPSAVLDVVKNPARMFPGNTPGTSVFIRDNLKVITNKAGDIITVIPN